MFTDKKARYMTKAIQDEVPAAIQLALWVLIDARVEENAELDYFQIFELSFSGDGKEQVVLHRKEVPRDQYVKAVELFEKRIEKGQVPGESNPVNARKYVKKVHLTYEHAKQVGKAGTIPSLGLDTVGALKSTLPNASLLLAISYFNCRGQGMSHQKSMKQSGAVFGRSLGVGFVINVSDIQTAKYMAGKNLVKDLGVLTARGLEQE